MVRGQVEARLANTLPCLIDMEACVSAHHLSRKLQSQGHDARLMPAKYVRPYSRAQKNDFCDAVAIAEAVRRPTMKFVATKTADQLRRVPSWGEPTLWSRSATTGHKPVEFLRHLSARHMALSKSLA
jgi:hypothetical protein